MQLGIRDKIGIGLLITGLAVLLVVNLRNLDSHADENTMTCEPDINGSVKGYSEADSTDQFVEFNLLFCFRLPDTNTSKYNSPTPASGAKFTVIKRYGQPEEGYDAVENPRTNYNADSNGLLRIRVPLNQGDNFTNPILGSIEWGSHGVRCGGLPEVLLRPYLNQGDKGKIVNMKYTFDCDYVDEPELR